MWILRGFVENKLLKRPLSDEKLQYAADNVRYLIQIKNNLEKHLNQTNRFSWFNEEQENELNISNIIIDPENAWKKINYPLYLTQRI